MCEFVGWCKIPLEAQAAWAQAILSVVGIGLAIWLPIRMATKERKRRYFGVEGLFISLFRRVDTLYARARDQKVPFGKTIEDDELGRLIKAMDSIPAHDLPDAGLIFPVIEAITASQTFRAEFAQLSAHGQLGTQWTTDRIEVLRKNRQIVLDQYLLVHRMGAYRFGSWFYRWQDRRQRLKEQKKEIEGQS